MSNVSYIKLKIFICMQILQGDSIVDVAGYRRHHPASYIIFLGPQADEIMQAQMR